jgi:hypothetical protein
VDCSGETAPDYRWAWQYFSTQNREDPVESETSHHLDNSLGHLAAIVAG